MPIKEWDLPAYVSKATPVRREVVRQAVAFRDCDPMGVLWHGNYLAYCELARNQLGVAIGLGVCDFERLRLFAPVVRSQLSHPGSARPGDELAIEVALYPTDQPRLYHRYHITCRGALVCNAETEQVLTRTDFTMLLQQPPEIQAILRG